MASHRADWSLRPHRTTPHRPPTLRSSAPPPRAAARCLCSSARDGDPHARAAYCWHRERAFHVSDPSRSIRCTAAEWRNVVRADHAAALARPLTLASPVSSEAYTPEDRLRDLVVGKFLGVARDRTRRKAFRSLWWEWWGRRSAVVKAQAARRAQATPDDRVDQLSERQRRRRARERPPDEVLAALARVSVSGTPKSSASIHLERRARIADQVSAAQ